MSEWSAPSAARDLEAGLRARGDPARAEEVRRYLKSELEHLGVNVPALRQVAKGFVRAHPGLTRRELLPLVSSLWREPVFELRLVAVELLVLQGGLLRPDDLPLLRRLIRESGTWALVDVLAATVVGRLVERFPAVADELDAWAQDDVFWVRRSALLALLGPLRRGEGDFARFSRYADGMLAEREFFIRKAIGWVLRETAKKRPDLVYHWLEPRIARASGVTVREAIKYLPEDQRTHLLTAHRR